MSTADLITRRQWLQSSAVGFGGLAFNTLAASEDDPLFAKEPHHTPRAKRIVFLFMKGGPSHVDTFDPKPLLDRDHGKPLPFAGPEITFAKQGNLLKSPWKFHRYGESGLPVSELFPQVAKHVDKLCVLRSVHGTNPAHGAASLKLHTGAEQFVRPSFGSWVTYGLGTENQNLPAFITICPTLAHGGVNNWGAAFLPSHCQGTPLGNASLPASKVNVKHIRNSRFSRDQQRRQIDLIGELNRGFEATAGSSRELARLLRVGVSDAGSHARDSGSDTRECGDTKAVWRR